MTLGHTIVRGDRIIQPCQLIMLFVYVNIYDDHS